MNWEESWKQNKYEVGKAMHAGWKRQKILNGFADHPWPREWQQGIKHPATCQVPFVLHHDDMIPWDELPPEQQTINYEGGKEGYRLGYEVGHMDGSDEEWKVCCARC